MPILEVSKISNTGFGDTPTLTLPATAVNPGDTVLGWCTAGDNIGITKPASLTNVCAILISNFGQDFSSLCSYLWAAGGEEGSILSWALTSSDPWTVGALIARGVHPALWDVAPVHAIHHISGEDNPNPQCPALNTVTPGAWVVEVTNLGGNNATGISSDDPAAVPWINQISSGDNTLATYKEENVPGAHGGAIHAYANGAALDDWGSFALALRPLIPFATGGMRSRLNLRMGLGL